MDSVIIGVDEAGRGPVIGPLVVSAVRIPNIDVKILEEMGVKDSKKINKIKRKKIFESIMENCKNRNWKISKIICSASEIDKYIGESSLNQLEVKLFSSAIEEIGLSKKIIHVNVDACDVDEIRFGKNIEKELGDRWKKTEIISKHKMDEIDLVTAAASIIAKVTRDSEIQKLNDRTDFEIGSGYPSDLITRRAVKKMIVNKFPHSELRWSWKTVKDEWLKIHNRPLPVRVELGKSVEQKSLDEWTKSEW
ncbi:MAG: ribonuclease HII [Euryarchaeota archaeon]|nr:ribonuclease HII [Euryarchaeota archaeon]